MPHHQNVTKPWPWQPFQQCPLAWWISVPNFTKTPPPSKEISRHRKQVLRNNQQTYSRKSMGVHQLEICIWPNHDLDLWPQKTFLKRPLTWWIFVPKFHQNPASKRLQVSSVRVCFGCTLYRAAQRTTISSSCRCCPISSRSLSTWLCSLCDSAISWSRRCLSHSSWRWCSISRRAAFTSF